MTWTRSASSKHARRSVTCACGRVIWGNAFSNHKWSCSAWLTRRAEDLKVTVPELLHQHHWEANIKAKDCEWCFPKEETDGEEA